jgi:predicted anti-sigma-YlaC factor YlaD
MKLFSRSSVDVHISQEMVSAFLDGALSTKEMSQVDLHMASCEVCAQDANELRSVISVLGAMPTVPAPRSFAIPVPGSAWVPEPSRPWWSPAPLMGLRAAAVGAAIALAIVFAGDLSGGFGSSPDVPIQVGRTEPAPIITNGTPAGAEKSLPLGEDIVVDGGTSAAVEVTADTLGSVDIQPSLVVDDGFLLGLWPLELGLLLLTVALGGFNFVLRRRSSSL